MRDVLLWNFHQLFRFISGSPAVTLAVTFRQDNQLNGLRQGETARTK